MKDKAKLKSQVILQKLLPLVFRDPSNKTSLIILSIIIGVICGLMAVLLKISVDKMHELSVELTQKYSTSLILFFPMIGIILTLLFVKYPLKGKHTKGLGDIIHSISRGKIDIPFQRTYSHIVASALTVGLGGSVGLEAPIAATGAAIGSNIAQSLKLDHKLKTLLLACGSAAGISAIFNSPIAGVIFSIEVLVAEVSVPFMIPIIISSASAAVVSKMLYGGQLFILVTQGWVFEAIPYYIVLGVLCGLISAYTITVTFNIEKYFHRKLDGFKKVLIGGLCLSILVLLFLPLYGEGYSTIEQILNQKAALIYNNSLFSFNILPQNSFLLLFVFLLIMFKPVAAAFTIGAGGDGGIIAPSLFIGALTGFFLAQLCKVLGIADLNTVNFIAVGMAGVISGVIRAPLTGIFLIAEITGGYLLIVPLMIVASFSYFISKYFEPDSIYTKAINENAGTDVLNHDKNLLSQISIRELIETDFISVAPNYTLSQLLDIITHSKRNIFPVVDDKDAFLGVVYLDDIREVILEKDLYEVLLVYEFMHKGDISVAIDENMYNVMEKFEKFRLWNLPVIDNGKYVGFVSKSSALSLYREQLVEQSKAVI